MTLRTRLVKKARIKVSLISFKLLKRIITLAVVSHETIPAPKAQLGLKKGKKVEPISLQNVDGKSKKVLSGKEAKVAAEGKKRRK